MNNHSPSFAAQLTGLLIYVCLLQLAHCAVLSIFKFFHCFFIVVDHTMRNVIGDVSKHPVPFLHIHFLTFPCIPCKLLVLGLISSRTTKLLCVSRHFLKVSFVIPFLTINCIPLQTIFASFFIAHVILNSFT